jgi:hypothetical protein
MLSSVRARVLAAPVAVLLAAQVGCNFGNGTTTSGDGGLDVTTGQSGGILVASPTSEDFGTVELGQQSAAATITVTNAGQASSGTITTGVAGADSSDFGVDSDGCSGVALEAGATCSIKLHFKPATAGAKGASLTISGESGGLVAASLSGVGASSGALSLSPSTQDLGTAPVGGAPGTPATFTLTNKGTSATGSVTVGLSGTDSADFALASDGCSGKTLAAGATCTVGVAFGPKTAGAKAATLTAKAQGTSGSATASLSGTAVTGAAFTVTPSPFDFGSVEQGASTPPEQTFTLKNGGGAASGTPALAVGGPNAADFTVTSNACTGALAAGATCTFGVTFKPTTAAAESATVSVSAPSTTAASLKVSGTGLGPAAIAVSPSTAPLGSVVQGAVGADVALTVTNTGAVTTGTLATQLQGSNADQFAVGTDGCSGQTLAAGASCTIDVHAAPKATGTAGPIQASLQIGGSPGGTTAATLTATAVAAAGLTVTPTSQAMGTVAAGTNGWDMPFVVQNTGGSTSGTLKATLGGANATQFALGADACSGQTLPAGQSCTVNVHFAPGASVLGTQQGTLTVAGTPGGSATATLTGTAAPQAAITIGTPQPFGSTAQGAKSADQTLVVKNGGGVPTGYLQVALGGANAGQFALAGDTCTGQSLAAGTGSCNLTVHFAPTLGTLGAQLATLSVTGNPGGTANANLTGTAVSPLTVTPGSATLANGAYLVPGAPTSFTVTSASLGSVGPLTVNLGGTNGAQFAIDAPTTTCSGATLTAAAPTCTIGVKTSPQNGVTGALSGAVQVSAGANTSAQSTFTSTALKQATFAVATAAGAALPFTFPTVHVGSPTTQMFTLSNTGAVTSGTPSFAALTGNFAYVNNACTAPVAAGGSCAFGVQFTPPNTTPESTTLTVSAAGTSAGGTLGGTGGMPVLEYLNANGAVVPSFDFGPVLVAGAGAAGQATFYLRNTGPVATFKLLMSSLDSDYNVKPDACSGQPLAPGAQCAMTVIFQVANPCQTASTTLTLGDGTSSASLPLKGTGVASGADYLVTINPNPMHLAVGATGTFVFTLRNCGSATGPGILKLGSDSSPSWFPPPYFNDSCTSNPGLAPLQSCSFDLAGKGAVSGQQSTGYVGIALSNQTTIPNAPQVICP